MHDIAGNTNRGTGIFANLADFTALQPDNNMLALHHPGAVVLRLFLFGYDGRVCSSAAAKDGLPIGLGPNIVNDRPDGNHVHGQAISSPSRFRGQDTRIDNTAHAVEQVLGNASPVALHHISGTHALGRHDVGLVARRLLVQQGDMSASARIIFDTLDSVRARFKSVEVDGTNSSLVATSAMPDRDATSVVPATFPVALLGECQGDIRPALPQVIDNWPLEMSKTRCPRFVRSHLDRLNLVRGGGEGGHVAGGILSLALYPGGITSDAADAKGALAKRGEGGDGGCPRDQGPETRLQHRSGWILSSFGSEARPRSGKSSTDKESMPEHRSKTGVVVGLQRC